jgi:uncharacterized membrane protein YhaH (DUF805 family)
MATATLITLLLVIALVAANLPWLSERNFFVKPPKDGNKRVWMRLLEWLVLYGVVGVVALGIERTARGDIHPQQWEFIVVTLALFAVFAAPGFIYRHQLRHFLDRRARHG